MGHKKSFHHGNTEDIKETTTQDKFKVKRPPSNYLKKIVVHFVPQPNAEVTNFISSNTTHEPKSKHPTPQHAQTNRSFHDDKDAYLIIIHFP